MKKSILALVAGALVLGASLSAQAQVYSVNAVGFVNLGITAGGYQMICNPLNGATNTISVLFASAPTSTQIYKWDGSEFVNSTKKPSGSWTTDFTLVPGEGVFVLSSTAFTNTFVGEVLTGNLVVPLPAGYSIVSSQLPMSGTLDSMGFPKVPGDQIYFFDLTLQEYVTYTVKPSGSWSAPAGYPAAPTVAPGQSFFVLKAVAADWTRNFSVN